MDNVYNGLCAIAKGVKNPVMRQRIYGLALARQVRLEKEQQDRIRRDYSVTLWEPI